MMLNLLDRLPRGDGYSIDTIVHIGAGGGEELDAFRALRPRRLILVEGDPESAETLRQETADLENVEILECAMAPEPGTAIWYRFSLPGLNGLLAPSGIYQLYPRLRLTERLPVETVGVAACMQSLGIESGASNLLVLDTPGLEARLLERLPEGLAHGFEWILLRGCANGLFEGCQPALTAVEQLEQHCFRLYGDDSTSDPARPVRLMVRDDALIENRSLQASLASLNATLADQTAQKKVLQEEIVRVKGERDEQTRLAGERLAAITKLSDECAALIDQRDEQARLTSKQELLTSRLAELEAQLKQASLARDTQTKLANERYLLIQKLTQERDAQAKLASERQTRIEQLESQLADLHQRQRLMDDELTKAEAQIELIKDVLIREKAF